MPFILWTLIFLLGIFLAVKKVENDHQHQNLPPGPWGLPFLGHLVSLGLSPHLTLMKWKKKYGPIIKIRFGSFPTVLLCDPKVIKEAFGMLELAGRIRIQVFLENNLTVGLGGSEGPYNTELRQFTIRKLKEFGMGKKLLEGKIQEGISEFLDFIQMREGLPIKSEDIPSAHIFRTLWPIMMKEELKPSDAEDLNLLLKQMIELGPVVSELAGFMPCLENLIRVITFGHCSLISTRSKQISNYYAFFTNVLQKRKQNSTTHVNPELNRDQLQTPTDTDIMDFYLKKVEETTNKSSPFHSSHKSAAIYLGDIFAGGIHTIHTTLMWTFAYMAKNLEVQSKLQKEIDEVTGNSRLPSLEDQGQMPYADAVIHEVLRMSSVVPLGVPHKAISDVCFHGYTIKKDTIIFGNLYGIHNDPEIWGDPKNFRPQRWLGEQGENLKRTHFLAFSTGRRVCPGEALAREQLFLYVTCLFQRYNVNFHGKVSEVTGVFGVTLHPSKYTVVFNERQISTY